MSDNADQSQVDDQTPNTTDDAPQGAQADENNEQEMSLEDMRKALAAARKEAADRRVAAKEWKAKAEKFDELEESKKSELQKAQERIAKLEAEKADADMRVLRASVAEQHNVPASLLSGNSEEELAESAEALKSWAKAQLPETKGAPVVPGVGRESGGADRDAVARSILGLG